LQEEEFNNIIKEVNSELVKVHDKLEVLRVIKKNIQRFIPYKCIRILLVDNEHHSATVMKVEGDELDENIYSLDEKGILSQCYTSRQPLMINDISRSLLYNEDIDSLGRKNIFKILVVPILDNKSTKTVLGMVWIGIDRGFHQFIQEDIDNLIRFTNITKIKNLFLLEDTSDMQEDRDSLITCMEAKKTLKIKMKRTEDYFASTIHDIRTPMNAVVGFMELMLLDEKDEQKRSYINSTLKSGEHIIALINDALDMSKVASGKMTLDKSIFSPLIGLGDIAKLFHNSMRKNSINFGVYIDPLIPAQINSDLYRIKQIVNNLLSNALKFTPEDGDVIFEANYDREKNTLVITVEDTGIGIAEDRQKSIFSPYTQEKGSTCSKYGGTGLGLAISQQLSILLDGTLTLDSEQGRGSKFTLMLPCETPNGIDTQIDIDSIRDLSILVYSSHDDHKLLHTIKRYFDAVGLKYDIFDSELFEIDHSYDILVIDRDDSLQHTLEVQNYLSQGGKALLIENKFYSKECFFDGDIKLLYSPLLPDVLFDTLKDLVSLDIEDGSIEEGMSSNDLLKGHRVLVVDDSIINLKLMSEVLKKFQLDVVSRYNPKDALNLFEDETFDIVFVDQNMPIMNGDEAISRMREIEKRRGSRPTIIYALTGDADIDINDRMIRSGADRVFTKPLHIKDIYDSVSKAILAS